MKMTETEGNISLKAFNQLCDELSSSKLISSEECQYWLFERGYQAALNELIGNMAIAENSEKQILLQQKYLMQEVVQH